MNKSNTDLDVGLSSIHLTLLLKTGSLKLSLISAQTNINGKILDCCNNFIKKIPSYL